MITDEQQEFIEELTRTGQFEPMYGAIVVYAARRLPRRAGVRDKDTTVEVANEAFERLLSDDYAVWAPDELSVSTLTEYLMARIDDIVKNNWRTRQRDRKVQGFDLRFHEGAEDVVESAVFTHALEEAWLNAATARDEKVGEIVLEWLGGNDTTDGQAEALGIEKSQVYRLRTTAREILHALASEQEA